MRKNLATAAAILVVAAAVHVVTILAIPHVVMHLVMARISEHAGINTPLHARQPTAADRGIPLPSPDLLYSSCALDLAKGPVRVSVNPGPDYLSLAVFDADTDNVFVASDKTANGRPIVLLIAGPASPAPTVPADATLVRLRTTEGLLLLRGLASTPELAARNDAARKTLVCQPA